VKRLESIDALRGFDMLWIMGLSSCLYLVGEALGPSAGWLSAQMQHVAWEGFRHHDLIFPMFLFLAGCSWPFSMSAQLSRGRTRGEIARKVLVRALVLYVFGLVHGGLFKWDFTHLRLGSVLGCIGFAWAVAALTTLFCRPRTCVFVAVAFFFGYWAALRFLPGLGPIPAFADPFAAGANLSAWIDGIVRPSGPPDIWGTDGFITPIGAVSMAFLGVLAGGILRREDWSGARKTCVLCASAAGAFAAYLAFEPFCPCIKALWTGSFVLLTGALSLAHLAVFYWIIDVKGLRRWAFAFTVIGMNSITIYMAQSIIDFSFVSRFFLGGTMALLPTLWQPVLMWAGRVVLAWLFLWFLYRQKIFLKV